jgi:hypothetical protein
MIKFIPHKEIALSDAGYDSSIHKAQYRYNYVALQDKIDSGELDKMAVYRHLVLNDLFFIVLFVMEIEQANHPFVVNACNMVQNGPASNTLDIWARAHFKSTILTIAETIQYQLKNQTHCTGIFAYSRPAAKKFLRGIKMLLESSDLLKWCFPDVLYAKPETESPKWSEDDGLVLKGHGTARGESSIEAWGLTEGMPTGRHFERRVFDDLETEDIRESPDMLDKVFSKFEMAGNLATFTDADCERVIGTYYSHFGPNIRIRDKQKSDGTPLYKLRLITASDNGKKDGNPVLMNLESWEKEKTKTHFNSQQLCNPTPDADIKLDFNLMHPIEPRFMPKNRLKFVIIDPAGDDSVTKGVKNDNWAMGCVSVEPSMDDLGTSAIYIEDIVYGKMSLSEAVDAAVSLYIRNGRITGIGVERVGTDSTYEHIRKGLLARGRHVKIKSGRSGNLVLLSTGGKSKNRRIESALSWPLNNGKIFYSTAINDFTMAEIKDEFSKFPFYHVDIIDMISYIYTILDEMKFTFEATQEYDEDEFVSHETQYGRSKISGY